MTVNLAITRTDSRKPNAFSTEEKKEWLASLEGRIAAEVLLLAPAEVKAILDAEKDGSSVLLVNPPFDDIYILWLCAMIDMANGEYNKYGNTSQIYNDFYHDFVRWFINEYQPAQGHTKEELLYVRKSERA